VNQKVKFRFNKNLDCLDVCEHTGLKIGSNACSECNFYEGISFLKDEVTCSYEGITTTKADN